MMQREIKLIGKKGEELLLIDKKLDIIHRILNKLLDNKRLGVRLDFKFTDNERNGKSKYAEPLESMVDSTIKSLSSYDGSGYYRQTISTPPVIDKTDLSIELTDVLTIDIFSKFSSHYIERRRELKREIQNIINQLKIKE